MQIIRILYSLVVLVLCNVIQTSEYFPGYHANEPVLLEQSRRAREYERAQSASMKASAAGFYNRLKGALGFKPSAQPRPRVAEYDKAYAPAPISPLTTQPKGAELAKAYEAEARKDYQYAKQARTAAERVKEEADREKDKAWDAANKIWWKQSAAYGNPRRYEALGQQYKTATAKSEEKKKAYWKALDKSSKARDEYYKQRSAYKDIKDANEGRDSATTLRELEARIAARQYYPWYRRISRSGNY